MWLLFLVIAIVMLLDLSSMNLDEGLERLLYVEEDEEIVNEESIVSEDSEQISLDENFGVSMNSSESNLASDDDVLRAINEMYNKGN